MSAPSRATRAWLRSEENLGSCPGTLDESATYEATSASTRLTREYMRLASEDLCPSMMGDGIKKRVASRTRIPR